MATLRDVMMGGDEAAPPAMDPFEAAALRQSRYVGGRYQAPREEGIPPSITGAAAAAADPLGIPSWAAGLIDPEAKKAWRDYYSENPSDAIFGSLAPVPFAGKAMDAAGAGVRMLAKPVSEAIKRAPATMAGILGVTGASSLPTEAAEGSKEMFARAGEYQPQIDSLNARIKEQQKTLEDLGRQKAPEPGSFKSARAQKAAEERASKASDRITRQMDSVTASIDRDRARLAEVQGIQDGINKEARAKAFGELPMVERVPAMGSLAGVGGVLAAASAYNPRLRAVMANRQFAQDLNMAMPEIEAAAAGASKLTPAGNVTRATKFAPTGRDITAIEQAREMVPAGRRLSTAGEGSLTEGLKAAPAGMAAALEGSILPYQLDFASQGRDTPAYKAAVERFTTGEGWLKNALASLIGGTGSMVGAKIPTHRAPATTLESDLARAQGAVNAFDIRQAAAAAPVAAAAKEVRTKAGAIPLPSTPALTKESAASRRGATTDPALSASAARVEEARRKMDEAFAAAGAGALTPERVAITKKIQEAKSASEILDLMRQYWR